MRKILESLENYGNGVSDLLGDSLLFTNIPKN
jgi:hypothetical protein